MTPDLRVAVPPILIPPKSLPWHHCCSQSVANMFLLVVIEGEEEYKVERILSKRKRYGKVQYLVCWKEYTAKGDI